jgi:hypothetical protein
MAIYGARGWRGSVPGGRYGRGGGEVARGCPQGNVGDVQCAVCVEVLLGEIAVSSVNRPVNVK